MNFNWLLCFAPYDAIFQVGSVIKRLHIVCSDLKIPILPGRTIFMIYQFADWNVISKKPIHNVYSLRIH